MSESSEEIHPYTCTHPVVMSHTRPRRVDRPVDLFSHSVTHKTTGEKKGLHKLWKEEIDI